METKIKNTGFGFLSHKSMFYGLVVLGLILGLSGFANALCIGVDEDYQCGDTIMESCTMDESLNADGNCFTVGASNIVIDGAGYSITGNGSGDGIRMNGITNVTIKNFKIYNFSYGIYLNSSSKNSLINNTANSNVMSGIHLLYSNNNTLRDNTADNNCFPVGGGGGGGGATFHISQLNSAGVWNEMYAQAFQTEYSTKEFKFSKINGKVKLRIIQLNTDFADVERIKLTACGLDLVPEYAIYASNGESVLGDILTIDNNVVVAHEKEIEVSWSIPQNCVEKATMYLTANEYGSGIPLMFPENQYADYAMHSITGSITLDGKLTETDGIKSPLYSYLWRPTSGHPDGYTYIYISDDSQNVYISLDITSDNTDEYGEDWAEITILTKSGEIKKFRIDDFNSTYGKCAFGVTSKVSYKHQTCEFAVPKNIIGDADFRFNLRYYGTLACSPVCGGVSLVVSSSNSIIHNNANSNGKEGIVLGHLCGPTYPKNNILNDNTACFNPPGGDDTDIVNLGSLNTGNRNKCDTTYHWNDIGKSGCTYSCILNIYDAKIKGLNIIDPPNAAKICIGRTTTLSANVTVNATDPNDPLLGNVSLCINVTCPGYFKNEKQYLNLTGILSATVRFNVTPNNTGLCNIMTCVDCDNAIPEYNEDDNCGNTSFTAVDCNQKHGVPISPLVPLAAVLVLTLIAV